MNDLFIKLQEDAIETLSKTKNSTIDVLNDSKDNYQMGLISFEDYFNCVTKAIKAYNNRKAIIAKDMEKEIPALKGKGIKFINTLIDVHYMNM